MILSVDLIFMSSFKMVKVESSHGSALLLFFSVLKLAVLTGVRYLQTSLENVLKLGNPDSEAEGWLLENSIAETARYNFNIIKNLGKCYQVDDDPNIDVPSSSGNVPTQQIPLAS